MKSFTRKSFTRSVMMAGVLASAAPAMAVNYSVAWLDFSTETLSSTPIVIGGNIASGNTFNLPGYGDVRVTYSVPTVPFVTNWNRAQSAPAQNGNVTAGPDNYAWTTQQTMNSVGPVRDDTGSSVTTYTITYTFLNGPVSAGGVVFGSHGLGRKDHPDEGPARITVARVSNNGTFLGDWDLGGVTGATLMTDNSGNFLLENSVPQPTVGAARPDLVGHFNTDLGLTLIDDTISSITVDVTHIDEDGIGFGLGYVTLAREEVVPEPTALSLLTLGGAALLRRRRAC